MRLIELLAPIAALCLMRLGSAQELKVTFRETCDTIRYNNLYLKFELTLPVSFEGGQSTEFSIRLDKALKNKDSKLRVLVHQTNKGQALLSFLCDTFLRCKQLEDEVKSNPTGLQRALKFIPGYKPSKQLTGVHSSNAPVFNCPILRWVEFQRRVDGSLSFAQNWDAYVNGFGHPNSNYWMGLEKLFAMTVTSVHTESARCRLRIETEDLNGEAYWGEYHRFEVLGPETTYRIRIGKEQPSSMLDHFVGHHNERPFSTYDKHQTNCAQQGGYGGWWYHNCHYVNLNGAYTTDHSITNNLIYSTIHYKGRYIPMKRTLMKFMCY